MIRTSNCPPVRLPRAALHMLTGKGHVWSTATIRSLNSIIGHLNCTTWWCFHVSITQIVKKIHIWKKKCWMLRFFFLRVYYWDRRDRDRGGGWIYNYLCNQCLSPLTLWVRIPFGGVYSIQDYVIKFVSDLLQVGGFLRYSGFSTNKTDHGRHDVTEILLKVALNTITHLTPFYRAISSFSACILE